MHNTTINGEVATVEQTHRAWAEFLEVQDRFESGRGLASRATRSKLEMLVDKLGMQAKRLYEEKSPLAGQVMNRMVRLEQELAKLDVDSPLPESFHVRKAEWHPSEDRLDGDSDELEQSAEEAEAEAVRLRFQLHAIRKTTVNRIELCKAGLVPSFSWKDAWATTKREMRTLGAEIRKEEAWAKAARRELELRQREVDAEDNLGSEVDPDWQLPSEDEQCTQLRAEEGR